MKACSPQPLPGELAGTCSVLTSQDSAEVELATADHRDHQNKDIPRVLTAGVETESPKE